MGRRNPLYNDNKLKLGLFCANNEGALSANALPERWHASWENNIALARLADEAGLEFMLPASRWIGWGGHGYHEDGIESIVWTAGLAHATRQIAIFATVHVPMFPPLVAAKQMAAVDQLLEGRFGLNIVCGWNQQEAAMFGTALGDKATQYEQAQEWLDLVRVFWSRTKEPTDFDGRFYKGVRVDRAQGPGPYDGEPVIFNAAFSPTGRAFAARNSDFMFDAPATLESAAARVRDIKAEARDKFGRDVGLIATAHFICRPTRAEAEEYHHHVLENADDEAVDNLLGALGMYNSAAVEMGARVPEGAAVLPEEQYRLARVNFITGHGAFGPLVGTPDDVASGFAQLSEAGYDGLALGLINYLDEFPYFAEEVLPRLEAFGLRNPALTAAGTG